MKILIAYCSRRGENYVSGDIFHLSRPAILGFSTRRGSLEAGRAEGLCAMTFSFPMNLRPSRARSTSAWLS